MSGLIDSLIAQEEAAAAAGAQAPAPPAASSTHYATPFGQREPRSQKSRRCYQRVMSGLERGGQLRFLTLTSSNESPETCQKSWRALVMRLRRRGLLTGYIKVPEMSKNGKQHLHILCRGSYIEQKLISQWWGELHHARVVDIRAVGRGRSRRAIAGYMAKYMAKENLYRYSWDWGWVWRGFCHDWTALKKAWRRYNDLDVPVPFGTCLAWWKWWLHGVPPSVFALIGQPLPIHESAGARKPAAQPSAQPARQRSLITLGMSAAYVGGAA